LFFFYKRYLFFLFFCVSLIFHYFVIDICDHSRFYRKKNKFVQSSIWWWNCVFWLLLLNSYSMWHRHQTTHARKTICRCREKNPRREKKNLSFLNLSLRRSSSISRHWLVAATFVRSFCCYFLYQLQKIVCAINQTSM
jgi:hypothetical protein